MADNNLDEQLSNWLERDPDPDTRDELTTLDAAGETGELAARFAGRLQFGTAGLRGIVGGGPSRMNRLVVRETSSGLGNYLIEHVTDATSRGVVIAYDARPDSERFAKDAACVLSALGFRVYLTDEPQPTPIGAFAVLHHGAAAGVVVTASHNPPEYNGYKVYWENGAQIIPPHDEGIANAIDAAAAADIPWRQFEDGLDSGSIVMLGDELTDAYCRRVTETTAGMTSGEAVRIGVAYSPLHGVGAAIADRLLGGDGVCDLHVVASQAEPDGTFPTVAFPNPEEPGAMDAVIALARETDATLACANDPDADRLAVAARNGAGDYEMLSGDQVGVLLGDYLLSRQHGFTPIVCVSMVSSRMLQAIADRAGAVFAETLTGFKWLANAALKREDDTRRFLFAYEEALGYALGQVVRDKDGLSALLLFTRMAAELAADGRSVLDQLETLYRRYGLYLSKQQSIATTPGRESITARLRSAPPAEIAGRSVASTMDLRARTQTFRDGRVEQLRNHPADVLVYYLEDDARVIVRPSGTEPKTKCYYEVIAEIPPAGDYESALEEARRDLQALAEQHQASLPV